LIKLDSKDVEGPEDLEEKSIEYIKQVADELDSMGEGHEHIYKCKINDCEYHFFEEDGKVKDAIRVNK